MGTKTRKKKQRIDLFAQARRAFEKGNYRQALKDAKQCFRRAATSEHRSLLEHIYIARARALAQSGLRDESRSVLNDLLKLGVTEPAVEAGIAELSVALGMYGHIGDANRDTSDGIEEQLAAKIADHAVLRPDEAPAGMSEMQDGAVAVRRSLEALSEGNAPAALEEVKGIPRSSPFADWKLLVRGLAAYYRQNFRAATGCWNRLAPDRFAVRIAGPLQALAQPSSKYDAKTKSAIATVARQVSDSPVLTLLSQMRTDITAGRIAKVLKSFGASKKKLAKFDEELPARIARTLFQEILRDGDEDLLRQLMRVADPPDLDPNWNRAQALLSEQVDDDPEETSRFWKRYVDDLRRVTCLDERQRELARALVWERIANGHAIKAGKHRKVCRNPECDYADYLYDQAVECFDKSLKIAPTLTQVYTSLHLLQNAWGESDKAAETYRRLLEHHPDHLDALMFLTHHSARVDDPLAGREFALRAHRLKPLDRKLIKLASAQHVDCARHYALQKKFDEGRAEFLAAEALDPACRQEFFNLACRAIFEYSASDLEAARNFEQQTMRTLQEPTAALLVLAIEAVRYGLSKKPADDYYNHQWKTALKKKCQSQTAGWLAGADHERLPGAGSGVSRSERTSRIGHGLPEALQAGEVAGRGLAPGL